MCFWVDHGTIRFEGFTWGGFRGETMRLVLDMARWRCPKGKQNKRDVSLTLFSANMALALPLTPRIRSLGTLAGNSLCARPCFGELSRYSLKPQLRGIHCRYHWPSGKLGHREAKRLSQSHTALCSILPPASVQVRKTR